MFPRILRVPFAAAVALALAEGCFLPVPWHWKHQNSYSGFVLDRETGKPVEGATVWSRGEGTFPASAVTDETGAWTLPEVWDWHFGYWCLGWGDGTCLPYTGRNLARVYLDDLTVSAPGYRTLEIPDFHEWEERKWFFDHGWFYDPRSNPLCHLDEFVPMADPTAVPFADQLANVSKTNGLIVVRLAPEPERPKNDNGNSP